MVITPKKRFDECTKRTEKLFDNFQIEQQDMIYTSLSLGKQLEAVANILNANIANHYDRRGYEQQTYHFRDVYSFNIIKRYENMHEVIANLKAEVKEMRSLFYGAIGEHEEMKAILRDEDYEEGEDN